MKEDEVVMYIVVRKDLPVGKLAAQVGHAVQLIVERTSDKQHYWEWRNRSYPKIVLGADEKQLTSLRDALRGQVVYMPVIDEGRTVVEPGTLTAIGIEPLPRKLVPKPVRKLRLL